MARAGRQPKKRSRGSVLTKLLILVILAAIGLQLRSLHSQVQDAQAQRDALTAQVQAQEQENAALAAHRRLVIRLTCVGAFSALVIALAVVLIRKLHKAGRC